MEASVRTSPLTADVRRTCIPILFAMTEHTDISDTAVLSPGDRIRFVQKHAGMPSINALARSLDLKRSENLYQILKGNNGISKDLACRIAKCFPWFSITWLTTGIGEPFREPELSRTVSPSTQQLPLYTALDFLPDGTLRETDNMLTIETALCPSAELVTICRDDAMEPRLLPGAYLFLAPCTIEAVVFGRFYLIVTESYRLCRIIRRSDEKEHMRLVSLRPERYDDILLPQKDIRALYRICGSFQQMEG